MTKTHGRKIEKTSAVTFANVSSKNVAQFPRVDLKPAVPVPIFDVSPPAVFLSSACTTPLVPAEGALSSTRPPCARVMLARIVVPSGSTWVLLGSRLLFLLPKTR